jgi:hypothetical protein
MKILKVSGSTAVEVDLTPAEEAQFIADQQEAAAAAQVEAAERTLVTEARDAAKADAFVRTFIAMTPDEVATYVNGNVTDLASARVLLRRMALMLLYLAKQAYK